MRLLWIENEDWQRRLYKYHFEKFYPNVEVVYFPNRGENLYAETLYELNGSFGKRADCSSRSGCYQMHDFDGILCDYLLGSVTAIDVIRLVRRITQVPIIILSAMDQQPEMTAGRNVHFVSKTDVFVDPESAEKIFADAGIPLK